MKWYRSPLLVDVPVAIVFALAVVGAAYGATHVGHVDREPLNWIGYLVVAVTASSLAIRRIWPLAAVAVSAAGIATYLSLGFPYGPIYFIVAVTVFAAARLEPVRRSLPAAVVAVVAVLVPELVNPPVDDVPYSALISAWYLVPWAVGAVLRVRRVAAERERADLVRRHTDEERLRIARDVHDVVGHGLAVINMRAGVALHVLDRRPEEAQAALRAIRDTSKEALDDLRRTLSVFRSDDAPRTPAPGLAQIPALVESMTDGGLTVRLTVERDAPEPPASVGLAAYRITQESLTNVVKHAGAGTATVRVGGGAGEVVIEVTSTGRPGPRATQRTNGHGIAGMRERAAAVGGTLLAGPRPEGGFAVRAVLPVTESADGVK